jgi:transcriptional regulator with XRE-family HTH domain
MKSDLLRAERIQHGWSQAKLAEELGVDTRTVRRWERGQAIPFPYYRQKLSLLLGKTAEELGLPSDIDEDNAMEEASPLVTQSIPSDTLTPTSFLADPAILPTLGNTTSLLGRDSLLLHVKEHLLAEDHPAFTALHGLPGSGKTALAAALVVDQQIQAHFSDGILWAGLGEHPNVLGELARWGRLLGVTPTQVENIRSWEAWGRALRATIGTRRFLLVIEDAWSVEDALAFQIGGPQCCHMLTTRLSQIAFTFAQQGSIFVPQLQETDGLALLTRFVPHLVEQDLKGTRALVQAVDGLPLALTLMGSYLVFQSSIGQPQPMQRALAQLHDAEEHLRMSMPNVPGERSSNLAEAIPLCLHAALALSNQRLSQQAHTTLRTLATFPPKPSSFSEEEALAASQQPAETLDELCDAGLLESSGSDRYSLHQTVVSYIRTQSEVSIALQQQVNHDLQVYQQATDLQIQQQEMHSLIASLSFHLFHWKIGLQKVGEPKFQPFKRAFPHPLLIVSVTLLAIIAIGITIPLALIHQAPHTSAPVEASYSPPPYASNIQNDPSLSNITPHLLNVFNAIYPQLVNRFALNSASAPMGVVGVTFSPDLSSPASISGTMITFNSNWLQQHPNDVGLFTHELALLVQNYPPGAPSWFSDGMADYARSVYGPADDDWSLPGKVQPQDSYTQGGGVAARFLLWLEQHTRLDIVDQLNHAIQIQQSFPTVFQHLTHHTVDELWRQYKAHPNITLTPQQIYKIVTSRKPIYYQQSPADVQCAWLGGLHFEFLQGIYMSNFAVQADMTFVKGDGGGGFIFRSDNSNQDRFRVSPDGTYDLVNQTQTLISNFSQAVRRGLNQTNQLTIIEKKHTIYVYINGQFVTQVDSISSYGSIGEMAYDKTTPAEVRFGKVQVF